MVKTQHYEIFTQTSFSAAHHLRGYHGKCEQPHGHNWTVAVYVHCNKLNEIGIGIDFLEIKAAVENIIKLFDHSDLNALEQFQNENPSSENIAKYVYRLLKQKLQVQGVHVSKVRIAENPTCSVTYWES